MKAVEAVKEKFYCFLGIVHPTVYNTDGEPDYPFTQNGSPNKLRKKVLIVNFQAWIPQNGHFRAITLFSHKFDFVAIYAIFA